MDTNTEKSLTTLSNAIELATNVVMKVAGEAVSNTVGGKKIPAADLKNALAATIQNTLSKNSGVI